MFELYQSDDLWKSVDNEVMTYESMDEIIMITDMMEVEDEF